MKSRLLDFLICPACLPEEERLQCRVSKEEKGDILAGSLQCEHCGVRFAIREGIAVFLSEQDRYPREATFRYEDPSVISSYLWSHYGDLSGDEDATAAYQKWAGLMQEDSGLALDAGCAAGRFTFEMSERFDFAVGIDNSQSFIRTARDLMLEGQATFSVREEGRMAESRKIRLPGPWRRGNVEFLVADAQALPFRTGMFSCVSSLNLIDKLPLPLAHLREMNRVAKEHGGQFLFSDPFSWSEEITPEENWLGGKKDGPYSGRGVDNVVSLLKGIGGALKPSWNIEEQGHVWWRIRNHRNHFELIRSCFVKAGR